MVTTTLVITWLIAVSVGVSRATTCTPLTQHTCVESLWMTGTCVDGLCECRQPDVYKPGTYGCQEQQTAEIKSFSGNVVLQTGVEDKLLCSPVSGGPTEWFVDGMKDDSEEEYSYSLATDEEKITQFKCRSHINGIQSLKSEMITITVEDNPTLTPMVEGMPETVVEGTTIALICKSTVELLSRPSPTWNFVGSSSVLHSGGYYGHVVTSDDQGKQILCNYDGTESEPVAFPDSFLTDIPGVEISHSRGLTYQSDGGYWMDINCAVTGADIWAHDPIMTYAWFEDGKELEGETKQGFRSPPVSPIEKSYTCQGRLGTKLPKSSSPVVVTFINTMGEGKIIPSSEGFLENGYFSLTCDFKAVNTTAPVTYEWNLIKRVTVLGGVTDKTLQFNSPSDDDFGTVDCVVRGEVGLLWIKSDAFKLDPLESIQEDIPVIPSTVDYYGVGNEETFTCKVKYLTPGAVFTWTLNDEVQTGQESQTFIYTPTSTQPVHIKCRYAFSGQESPETTRTINPKYVMTTVLLHSELGYPVSSVLTPVTSTNVGLRCDATTSASVANDADVPVTYQWLKDDVEVESATSQDYVITADADVSVRLKCAATANGDTTTSDAVTVTTQDTAEKPNVSTLDSRPYLGSDLVLYCVSGSVAEGATYVWKKDTQTIADFTSHTYEIPNLEASDKDTYSCKITVGGRNSEESDSFNLEPMNQCKWASDCNRENMDASICVQGMCRCLTNHIMENFQCHLVTAEIRTGDLPAPPVLTPVTSTSVRLSCHTTGFPDDQAVTYQWMEDGNDVDEATSRDHVHQAAGEVGTSVNITCAATATVVTVTSTGITITTRELVTAEIRTGDLPAPPVLTPVISTSVRLSCHTTGFPDDQAVTYQWMEDGNDVDEATSRDHVHQAAGEVGTSVNITCAATATGVNVTSTGVTITTRAEAAKPLLSHGDTSPYLDKELSLYCVSTSIAEEASYTWKKDTRVIAGVTTHEYQIPSVDATDRGVYACAITVGGHTSEGSEDFHLDTIYMCQTASDCDKKNMDSTVCEDGMCRCLLGSTMVNLQCAGASSLVASVVGVMSAVAFVTRLL